MGCGLIRLIAFQGSPLLLQKTATHGIISAVQRQSGEIGLSSSHRTDYIQTGTKKHADLTDFPALLTWVFTTFFCIFI
jgi:hypothetical protein